MVTLPLTQGKVALIDDEDFERVKCFKWYASKNGRSWYAMSWPTIDGKRRTLCLHRVITSCDDGFEVDHINHDGLDNQKHNLRVCKAGDNRKNVRRHRDSKHPDKCVYWNKDRKYWWITITYNGRRMSLYSYHDRLIAVMCYDFAAKYLHGQFASTNIV
jgi:hypothetical protein